MVRKRDVEGAVPYAKLYVCRGDHRSPNEKQIIDKRELRKEPPHRRLSRQLPSMGAIRKPLLEERCHEVTEWWQHNSRQAKKHNTGLSVLDIIKNKGKNKRRNNENRKF